MPKNSDKRGQIPRMKDLTIAEQDELILRWRLRKDLRVAYPEIVGAMLQWVIDSPDIEAFVAGGHQTHFGRIPQEDLLVRMLANGYTEAEFHQALAQGEAPASWMTSAELSSIVERIAAMAKYFKTHDPGPFAQALAIYRILGDAARRNFIQRNGYAPEQSPVPRVKIEGTKQEQKKLKPTEHQPSMFSEGEDEE